MADVSATLAGWLSTTASNAPSGATTIGTGLSGNLREIQGVVVRGLSHKGADIPSTATADVGAVEGFMNDVTGTTAITSLGTVRAGIHKLLKFEGVLTLTHNGTSLILPGAANITTADGDMGWFISEGSGNWRLISYTRANGSGLGPVVGTEQTTTSGATVAFAIPSWASKVTMTFDGVSTNGTGNPVIQIGDAGGLEATGYSSNSARLTDSAAVSVAAYTSGFGILSANASNLLYGSVTLTLQDPASFTWCASGNLTSTTGVVTAISVSGAKALSAALTTIALVTADTFDAGAINVVFE
jgi:hypothetical protein